MPQAPGQAAGQAEDHRDLHPQAAVPGAAGQGGGGGVQRVHLVQQAGEHLAQAGRLPGSGQVLHPRPGGVQQVGGQVAAVQRGQVLGAVLQVVQHLQRGAQRVGRRVGGRVLAVQVQHMAADRHGGQAAVVQQLRPGGVAALRGVLAEGGQQVQRVLRGDAGFGQAGAQAEGAGRSAAGLPEQHRPHPVQPAQLVVRGQHGAVGDVVGVAGEGVEGVDVRAQRRADQGGADREVLVRAVLAGPGLDGGGSHALAFP